jgi:peptidoglycan biosynthesis protein MviN/MurJ (putative lipid II flippase)
MELMGELRTCGLAMEPGMRLCTLLCIYGCTPLRSSVFTSVLSLVGGGLMEVSFKINCGGVSGALEMGTALASCSLKLLLELQLFSGLCKHDTLELAALVSHSLCLCCMVLGWWCWLGGLSVG